MREDRKSFRTITLKLRYNDFQDVTRSVSLEEPADMEQDVYPLLPMLLRKAWERRVSIRMVALKLSHIYGGIFRTELSLDAQSLKRENERKLATVLDQLRGEHSIMRGHDLWLKQRKNKPRTDAERCAPKIRFKPMARQRHQKELNAKATDRVFKGLTSTHGCAFQTLWEH